MAYLDLGAVDPLPMEVWVDLNAKWQAFRPQFATWIEHQRESAAVVASYRSALARWDGSAAKVLAGDLAHVDRWLEAMEGQIAQIRLPSDTYTRWSALKDTLATLPAAVARAAGEGAGDLIREAAKGLGVSGILGLLAVVGVAYVGIPVLVARLGR